MDDEDFIDRYLDVLQNMELAIRQVDKASVDLTDLEVMDALDNLMRAYMAEANGRSAPFMRLSALKRQVYDAVKSVAEWRMGRDSETFPTGKNLPAKVAPEPIPLDAILACLKRIRLSIKRWNGSNGRRGYLEYIEKFVM